VSNPSAGLTVVINGDSKLDNLAVIVPFNTFDHINALASDFNLFAKFIFNILKIWL
jgi:hypothetical protein